MVRVRRRATTPVAGAMAGILFAVLNARQIIAQVFAVYALRTAGVFLNPQATLWVRTGVMPGRWP